MTDMPLKPSWSGSVLVKATPELAERSGLPESCRVFLVNHGLPSNATWFEGGTRGAIMSFDGVAMLRDLTETDVTAGLWKSGMGRLIVLGIFRCLFIVADRAGRLHTVYSSNASPFVVLDERGIAEGTEPCFMNSSPMQFMECLIAYKRMRDEVAGCSSRCDRAGVESAFGAFEQAVVRIDPEAIREPRFYWAQILNYLEG